MRTGGDAIGVGLIGAVAAPAEAVIPDAPELAVPAPAEPAAKPPAEPLSAEDARLRGAGRDAAFRRTLALADLAAAAGALLLVHLIAGHPPVSRGLVSVPVIVLLAKLLGRYDQDDVTMRRSTLDEVPALATVAAFWAVCWSLVIWAMGGDHLGLGGASTGALWLLTVPLLVVLRTAARTTVAQATARERVLIVGSAAARQGLARSLQTDPGARIEVVGFLPLEDERRRTQSWPAPDRRRRSYTFADLARVVEELRVERVLLTPTTADSELMLQAVSDALALGTPVSIVPRLFEVIGSAVEFDTVGGVTVLGVRRPGLSRSSRALKRLTDVTGAAAGLIVLSPFFLVVAIAIKLDSAGPVFFRQARVGRDGRQFQMLKFRSMVDGAERQRAALEQRNETTGLFKIRDDPRITRVGRLVRRTSIDELPQLWNVLRGDMSLVGPRPLVIAEDRLVEGRHRERLTLAPGMTGPWQVLGPSRPPLADMVKTDYLYATSWSLWADIKILIRTLSHVRARRGL